MQTIPHLEQAINAIDSQRPVLGNETADASIAALRKQIHELMAGAGPAPEARKLVTVLFADLMQFTALTETLDPEDVHALLNACFAPWKAAVHQHNGTVERFIGDGMLALFGYPAATEQDPENALRAALQIRDGMHLLNRGIPSRLGIRLSMRIGISTGTVLIGKVGDTEKPAVTGDAANLASRLQNLAPENGILISHDTYRHVRGLFFVDIQPPVPVKGKEAPVQTYRVRQAKPRSFPIANRQFENRETRMVGRDSEFDTLCLAFRRLICKKSCQTLLITGEAGVGKSRLLYEFDNWAELQPESYRIFKARAFERTQNLPYYLVRDLFAFRFQISDSDSLADIRQKFESGMSELCRESGGWIRQSHFIASLLGYDMSDSPHLDGVIHDPRQLNILARRYIIRFFRTISIQMPVMIQVEDIHWADRESIELLRLITAECRHSPILTLCCARPDDSDILAGFNGDGTVRISLSPLSVNQSRLVVTDLLKPVKAGIPDRIMTLITGRAQGNPFYIEELIRMMFEIKGISVTGNEWFLNPDRLSGLHIPSTLFGLIQARLDTLPEEERHALKLAAVIGQTFWDGALFSLDQPSDSIPDGNRFQRILSQLQSRALILKHTVSAFQTESQFCFCHALVHEVAYETILIKDRALYHFRAADWLINKSGPRAAEFSGLIALHLEKADRGIEAAQWYAKAGRQAVRSFSPDTADLYFRKALTALDAVKADPSRPETGQIFLTVYEGTGDVMLCQARYSDALNAYGKMNQTAAAITDIPGQITALSKMAWVQEMKSDHHSSLTRARSAEKLFRQSGISDPGLYTEILIRISRAYLRLGKPDKTAPLIEQALDQSLAENNRHHTAQCFNVMGLLHEKFGQYDHASVFYQKALDLFRDMGNRDWISGMLSNIAEMNRFIGNFESALAGFNDALAIAREIGDRVCESLYISNIGGVLCEMGRYEEAKRRLQQAIDMAGSEGAFFLPWAYAYLAKCCLGLSDLSAAAGYAITALDRSLNGGSPEFSALSWNVLGQIAGAGYEITFRDRPVAALTCFRKSIQICEQTRMAGEKAAFILSWAQFEMNRNHLDNARTLFLQARNIFLELGLTHRAAQITVP